MIPWTVSYDKLNYAKYLSVYFRQMTNLPQTHPEIHKFMLQGEFCVQLGAKTFLGRLPVDQTIEETAIKDTWTSGGTKEFSLKPGAVSQYYVTAEYNSSE